MTPRTETSVGPVAARERIQLLDAVRGMALGGILLANLMSFFGSDMLTDEARRALPWSTVSDRVLFAVDWLVEGKFYSVFSILLGIGFALQSARAERGSATDRFAGFFRRRMTVLLVIGAVHMFALWSGDILMLYGLMGLFLPGLARLQSTRRTIVMLALFAVPLATHVTVVLSKGALDPRPPFAATGAALRHHWGVEQRGTLDLFARGSSADYFAWNTANAIVRPGTYLQSGRPAKVLALFLLGVWLGQAVLPRATTLQRALWLMLLIGAAVGLPTSFEYASIKAATRSTFLVSREGLVQTAAYTLGTTPLALAYLAGATLAWRTPSGRPWLEWFVPLGRMALTVYLTQSVVQLAIFSSHGLALAGRISIAWLPLVAALILGTQRYVCAFWLQRHAHGPLEWIWRSATYRGLNPAAGP
jgi:uncharacterized protein